MVIGTTEEEGFCRVEAEVPLAEMFGYSTDLRSATQGKARPGLCPLRGPDRAGRGRLRAPDPHLRRQVRQDPGPHLQRPRAGSLAARRARARGVARRGQGAAGGPDRRGARAGRAADARRVVPARRSTPGRGAQEAARGSAEGGRRLLPAPGRGSGRAGDRRRGARARRAAPRRQRPRRSRAARAGRCRTASLLPSPLPRQRDGRRAPLHAWRGRPDPGQGPGRADHRPRHRRQGQRSARRSEGRWRSLLRLARGQPRERGDGLGPAALHGAARPGGGAVDPAARLGPRQLLRPLGELQLGLRRLRRGRHLDGRLQLPQASLGRPADAPRRLGLRREAAARGLPRRVPARGLRGAPGAAGLLVGARSAPLLRLRKRDHRRAGRRLLQGPPAPAGLRPEPHLAARRVSRPHARAGHPVGDRPRTTRTWSRRRSRTDPAPSARWAAGRGSGSTRAGR